MIMVGMLVNHRVDARVGLDRVRAGEVGAGNHVPEVAVDRVDKKGLPERVPVVSPGIGRAMAEHLEPLTDGVIAPEAAAKRNARGLGRTRGADLAW